MSEVQRLAEEVAAILDPLDHNADLRSILIALKSASGKLLQIGDLVLKGAERVRAQKSGLNVDVLVERVQRLLDHIDGARARP